MFSVFPDFSGFLDMKLPSAVILLLVVGMLEPMKALDFSYDGKHGPSHWAETYQRCSGKHQSPININDLNVINKNFDPLNFQYFDEAPLNASIINNGHTVVFSAGFDSNVFPEVSGGPLEVPYRFQQFHFHWGENNSIGSEDLINNASFPAELHVVLVSLKYSSLEMAMDNKNGIAVLAYFFEISKNDNPSYIELGDLLTQITQPHTKAFFAKPMPLKNYLSHDTWSYYTYIGSLTTPPCAEDVLWIDFETPILISETQINRFRQLSGDEEPLMNNFRPVQPLNDRKIYKARHEQQLGYAPIAGGSNLAGKTTPQLLAIYSVLSFVALSMHHLVQLIHRTRTQM